MGFENLERYPLLELIILGFENLERYSHSDLAEIKVDASGGQQLDKVVVVVARRRAACKVCKAVKVVIVNLEEILEMPTSICCTCLMILLCQNLIGWVDNENGGRLIV